MRLELTLLGQTIYFRLDVLDAFFNAVHTQRVGSADILYFMRKQCYASLSDNTAMLSRCLWSTCLGSKEKPHLFLCEAVMFRFSARHRAFTPQTQGPTLILGQIERLQQHRPASHFVISGNR